MGKSSQTGNERFCCIQQYTLTDFLALRPHQQDGQLQLCPVCSGARSASSPAAGAQASGPSPTQTNWSETEAKYQVPLMTLIRSTTSLP